MLSLCIDDIGSLILKSIYGSEVKACDTPTHRELNNDDEVDHVNKKWQCVSLIELEFIEELSDWIAWHCSVTEKVAGACFSSRKDQINKFKWWLVKESIICIMFRIK